MTEGNAQESGRSGIGRTRRERVASSFEFFKKRLQDDASRISDKDIDELGEDVPEKLGNKQLRALEQSVGWVADMIGRVKLLFRMIRDRRYAIDFRTKALIAAALAYFVLPTDVIPDFIPGIGYLDDTFVLTILWNLIHDEIERYTFFLQDSDIGRDVTGRALPDDLGSVNDLP